MKFPTIKEPYKTAMIIATVSLTLAGTYLLLPTTYQQRINGFIKTKLKFKKDESKMDKSPNVG